MELLTDQGLSGIDGFQILHRFDKQIAPDFEEAIEIVVRIVARTYSVDVTQYRGSVFLNKEYVVNEISGVVKERK